MFKFYIPIVKKAAAGDASLHTPAVPESFWRIMTSVCTVSDTKTRAMLLHVNVFTFTSLPLSSPRFTSPVLYFSF